MLDIDIDSQNICCTKAFQFFKDTKSITISYRKLVRLRLSDSQCEAIGLNQEAYNDLDKEIPVPLELLDSINFKYRCDELCPFPACLDDLHAWEYELILNWKIISDALSWNGILPLTKIAAWHSISIEELRRWNTKQKRIESKNYVYRDFQPFVKYIPKMVK